MKLVYTYATGLKNVPTGTSTNLCSLSISAETYLLITHGSFQTTSGAGSRKIFISNASDSFEYASVEVQGNRSGYTTLKGVDIVKFASTGIYYCAASQGSGSAITVTGIMVALRFV